MNRFFQFLLSAAVVAVAGLAVSFTWGWLAVPKFGLPAISAIEGMMVVSIIHVLLAPVFAIILWQMDEMKEIRRTQHTGLALTIFQLLICGCLFATIWTLHLISRL